MENFFPVVGVFLHPALIACVNSFVHSGCAVLSK